MMNVTCIFFGILFTIAGFLFACGKGHIHLSAWKEMPQEEADTDCAALPQYRRGDCAQRHHFSDEGLLCRLYEPLVCDCHDCMVHCGRL